MAPPLLMLRDIHLTFGGAPLLQGAELTVSDDERLCLVGRNGSGKSTLLKIAADQIEADAGERFVQPGKTIRYLPQEPDLTMFTTTRAVVEAGLAPGDDPHRGRMYLDALGLTGEEDTAWLSGGEARRCALAGVLAPEPDILLLDEPTNHLDLPAIEWLEATLSGLRSALVLISHDRRFLETLSRSTAWLHDGQSHRIERGFAEFESWRDDFLEREQLERHKLDRKLAAEADWLRYGVTARRKRNQGRMRALETLRAKRREQSPSGGTVKLTTTETRVSGKIVIEAKAVSKAFAGVPIVADVTARVQRGDRVGIIGPNGAGKTTLLGLLSGALAPDGGTVRLGANVAMVSLDQRRASLDPAASLADTLTGGRGDTVSVGGQSRHVIGYMKDFLFKPEQARTPVAALSGGERGRLTLARALAQPSNLLVLDEPTNDLDLETLDLLQEMLADYAGTVLLVSHDRDFLDRVVTSILAAEGNGRWIEYAGGYSDMLAQRGCGPTPGPRRAAKSETAPLPAEATPAASPAPSSPAPPRRRKLSFKQAHALKTLPARIEKLHAEIAGHHETLSDHDLYARHPEAFKRASEALSAAELGLAAAENEWLALELLREELEGA